ncbi:O-methylsterigmatocystin oxidoreductase [Leucoagaricus sp. SymC.cos]|nr:O-methylsterigmatocystin oxidoreductase [Leucoagaricus sp. SymC.cos]
MVGEITLLEGLTSFGVALCSLCLLSLWNRKRSWIRRNPKGLPTPPGPKGLPIIGSLLEMPMIKPWVVYNEWSKEYGSDFVYFTVLNKSFLVLNSYQLVQDLLVKRSDKYSDRPRLPMICEVMDYGWSLGFMNYNDEWREHRKALTKHFNHMAVQRYQDTQLREARAFLLRMLQPNASSKLSQNIRQSFAALIMDVSYGIRILDFDDPYIEVAEEAMGGLNEAAVPGAFLVDVLPALKHVPKWLPGAGWKRKAEGWKKTRDIFLVKPFEEVKTRMAQGGIDDSVACQLLQELQDDEGATRQFKEDVARNVTATAYLGGSDTTVCSLESFFVAMCLYPEVQRAAQAELDNLLAGTNSLPTFADRPKLPYILAVVEECLRWQIVAPLGVPHVLIEDDEYEGYFIPKGTLVLGNSWSILHNPQAVSEPSKFKPERYIRNRKFDPEASLNTSLGSFGFGRRICPGQYFTKDALFSMIASTLAVYDIKPKLKKDKSGCNIPLSDDVTSGFVSHPVPFECTLTVRSPELEQLIYNSVEIE